MSPQIVHRPVYPLRDLTSDEKARNKGCGFVKYEAYPEGAGLRGRYWTQEELNAAAEVTPG